MDLGIADAEDPKFRCVNTGRFCIFYLIGSSVHFDKIWAYFKLVILAEIRRQNIICNGIVPICDMLKFWDIVDKFGSIIKILK